MVKLPTPEPNRKKQILVIGVLAICAILLLAGGYLFLREPPASQLPELTTGTQTMGGSPTHTPTDTQNQGFLPLVSNPATSTPTPTVTLTPTPTVTPTPTPLILSFCDQAPAPLVIGDYETITDTLSVDYTGTILDLDLQLEIDHTYPGDLVALLKKENTQATVLLARPGSPPVYCSVDHISALFNDEALETGNAMCNPDSPAITGDLRPLQPLFLYDNQTISGLWQLVLSDQSAPDTGELRRWCLIATLR